MHRHAQPRGLANLLIEIRQDLVDTHHGASEWAELLARALAEILADPTIYKAEQVK
jgi:predicted N-formylglutamate amidohydrolase